MTRIATVFAASLALSLAACGSADDASTEAQADTVEIPANDALEGVAEEPVADADAASDEEQAAEAADTQAAADAAADVAAQVEAAGAADSE